MGENIVKLQLFLALLTSIFVSQDAWSQQTLDQMPAFERVKQVREKIGGLIKNSQIDNKSIEWSADGSNLYFERNAERLKMNLGSLKTEPTTEKGDSKSARTTEGSMMRWDAGVERAGQRTKEPSPDGNWNAVFSNNNVVLEMTDAGKKAELNLPEQIPVTEKGTDRLRYGTGCWVYGEELYQSRAMWWSPDSKKLVFYEIDEQHMKDYYLTLGNTESYTRIQTVRYPKAGDANPKVSLLVYDLESTETKRLVIDGEPEQYLYKIRFAPDGKELLVNRTNRHQNVLDVLAVDVESGAVRTVVTEVQETFQNNAPTMQFLTDGKRFVWETEKNGFKHFELRGLDGELINPLSKAGNYPCEEIVLIDETAGYFYYTAFSSEIPLNQQLHRVKLDGSDHRELTKKPFNHTGFHISPKHEFFVAEYEAIDSPPAFALYNTEGKELKVLAEGDWKEALEAGFSKPELFKFKADDGVTDIYGVLYKPMNFNEKKKYPLLIDVYGGPQSRDVTNRFRPANPQCELGFLIASIGNRGTIGRGKAFEAATYKKLGGPDIQDQADGVKFLAKRPYVDGGRVGIYGHSYGGYMSALAVLKFPDIFHVAVAGAPVTDWRNYDTIYTERYMQTPQENSEGYQNGSCANYAENLKGKLLLVHGLIDDNVHPSNTWQLSEKLQASDKRFDMMIYPNFQHGIGATYGALRWEYFIEHLKPDAGE